MTYVLFFPDGVFMSGSSPSSRSAVIHHLHHLRRRNHPHHLILHLHVAHNHRDLRNMGCIEKEASMILHPTDDLHTALRRQATQCSRGSSLIEKAMYYALECTIPYLYQDARLCHDMSVTQCRFDHSLLPSSQKPRRPYGAQAESKLT